MQLLASSELMKKFDQTAIDKFGIPSLVLMENAGRGFVDVLERNIGQLRGKSVLVVCGKGNNGGDGFVIARHLFNRGAHVQVVLLANKSSVQGDAKSNLDILNQMKSARQAGLRIDKVSSPKRFSDLTKSLAQIDAIVDAIFGTGFTGAVRGLHKDAIEWINSQRSLVASVDIPSGVNATTGAVENIAVNAHFTITMGLAKIGQYIGRGRDHSGKVEVVDISIPRFVLDQPPHATLRVEATDVRILLPRRPIDAHKYSVGRVLVIAGSRNLTGAPLMASVSAMRTGAGAVVLAVPKSIHAPLIHKTTEVMISPLTETEDGSISNEALSVIQEKLSWADAVALGPGLGKNPETREVVYKLLGMIDKPLVIDADALGHLAANLSQLKKRKSATVLTPHVGEFRLITKLQPEEIELTRAEVSRAWAKKLGCTIILKGAPTATGTTKGTVYLNSTGSPGMATAGSGDVLTGIVVSLIAQGLAPDDAAYCGVFIHGLAGDIAAKEFGVRSMMAMDILKCIPKAMNAVEQAATHD